MGDKLAPENLENGQLESFEPQAGTAGQEAGKEHLSLTRKENSSGR